jgi:hypothetical protein
MQLKSRHYEAPDMADAMELCYSKGWSDGLPVVPPTEDRIRAMLAAAALEPDKQLAFIENRQVSVTAEKVAINAVLAGCKPEYMPVVVAAVEALGDPLYGYHGPATSTGGSAVFMVVNGPIARELDMNCGDNLFGPGWRANATIAAQCGSSCATRSGRSPACSIAAASDIPASTRSASPKTRPKARGRRCTWTAALSASKMR